MATSYNKTILKSNGRVEEAIAGGTIKPGHLVELYNASGTGKFRVHSNDEFFAERLFAEEDALQGHSLDHDYSALDLVQARVCDPGDHVYAWIAASQTIVIGDKLVSNGNGTLKKATATDSTTAHGIVLAVALEAITTTDAARVAVRLV